MWIILSKCARLVSIEFPFIFVNSSLTAKITVNSHHFSFPASTKHMLPLPSSSVSHGDCTSSCLVSLSKLLMENMDNLWVWQIPILMLICSKPVLMVRRQLLCQVWRCWTRYTFYYLLSGPSIFFDSGHPCSSRMTKHSAGITETMLTWSNKLISTSNVGYCFLQWSHFWLRLHFGLFPKMWPWTNSGEEHHSQGAV